MDVKREIIEGWAILGQSEREAIGLSQLGQCPRRLWYAAHEPGEAEARESDSEFIFEMGRAFEASVVAALKARGHDIRHTGENQQTVTYMGIQGHPDGELWFHNEPDGPDLVAVLECKFLGDYGYKKLTRAGLKGGDYNYWLQTQAYMAATGADMAVFIVGNKGYKRDFSSDLTDINSLYVEWVKPEPAELEAHVAALLPVLAAPEAPERPYTKPQRFPCDYCPFKARCWNLGRVEGDEIPGMDE